MKTKNKVIAFDGHDGSGKTTLSKLFAEKTGGIYLRPFGGEFGVQLIDYFDKKEYEQLAKFASDVLTESSKQYTNELLVYDRHWMTVFSLLPPSFWEDKKWQPLPATVLCFSDLPRSLDRLKKRTEKAFDPAYHIHYLDLYYELGKKYNAHILRTDQDEIEECLINIVTWYKSL